MLERIDEYDFEDNPTAVRDLILQPEAGRARTTTSRRRRRSWPAGRRHTA